MLIKILKMKRILLTLSLVFALAFPSLEAQQIAHKAELRPLLEMQYLLYLPDGYSAESGAEFPLLLFLHGGGESGDNIERVKTHGPPGMIKEGKEFPFMVLSPQNPHPRKLWNETALITLLDRIVKEYRVDKSRIWVAGLSRGGYGAWRMAIQYPDRFAALVAVCGETPDHYARWLGDMPIWVFHGEEDRTISIKESDEMVAALKKNGNPVRYTKYPNTGHNAWDQAFSDPELYKWLLAQKKK
jgi:predicted peptidase